MRRRKPGVSAVRSGTACVPCWDSRSGGHHLIRYQRRFERDLEYDIVWDSMTDLQVYVGIETDAVDELLEADCSGRTVAGRTGC